MLKVEYPCREILSSYQYQTKPTITWAEAKKHLNEVRLRRKNELTININECYKLRSIHKQMFDGHIDSSTTEKLPNVKPMKSINNEYSLPTNKFSIPRIEYASVIYRKAMPAFELEPLSKLEDRTPIVKELVQHSIETPIIVSSQKRENNQLLLPMKSNQQRCFSVSSVASVDKRVNRVYEQWPDYNRISEIVGYRIDPLPSKKTTSNAMSSGQLANRTKRKVSGGGFPSALKQVKNLISLNNATGRRNQSKTKQSPTGDTTGPTIDKAPLDIETLVNNTLAKEIKPKLPDIYCPSSVAYSSRVRTRQWLLKNDFSYNATRTVPLL